MVGALSFPKWFSRLCWNFNKHYGQIAPEPVLAMDSIYEEPAVVAAATAMSASTKTEATTGDVVLDPTIPLTKYRLTMGMLGYISLCLEFKPRALCEFVAGLGTGRPFFSFFLHKSESLAEQVLLSLCNILTIKQGTELYKRIHDRSLFYDNDHLTPAAVKTLGLRTSRVASASLSLTDAEFTDMIMVAMYLHDLSKLDERFENAVISMIADQERREMVVKFMRWMLEFFVTPDIKRENNPLNTKSNERCKWQYCKKFNKVSFEDFMDCAAAATISSHLLRGAARSNSYVTLERLFEHYIRNNDPTAWKGLFQGSQTIAYFIKYVDVEDLNLAFSEFFKMNPENTCFKHHLLKVRKLLKQPIVSAQDLLQLTGSSSSFNAENATRFFNSLYEKADAAQGDLKMAYLLTASWMKIMKQTVLCPLPPRNAQIITLLTVASWAKSLLVKGDMRMGKALIAQVGTGEGKSLIIAMMAIYFVKVLNKRVHILENNPGLLSKDVEMMKPLFAAFGIKPQHEGPGAELKPTLTWTSMESQNRRDCRSEFCKAGVTYCLRRNLERYYQDSIMAGDHAPLANTVLIVDEVDDLIVDEKPNQPYAAKDCEQPAFQAACREAQVECDALGEEQFDVGNFANGDFVRETAAEAYLTAKKMVLGEDYSIVSGQYVILIDKKPFELYDPALECLKFIKHGQPPHFSSTYYVQSVPYILSQYDCITGFSGSLGSPSERAFLAQQYKAWSFDTPSFLNTCTNVYKVPPTLMCDPQHPDVPAVHVYDSVDQQVGKVVEMCLRMHLTVPVLVIARSTEEAIEIEAKVRAAITAQTPASAPAAGSKNKFVQLFGQYKQGTMVLDQENWDRIVRRATSKGPEEDRFCITVTDPFGGRGHDFDVHDDEVDRLGGLAVITTSIPASEREWRQWKGRTSRKDHKGQYAVVLCKEHSPVSAAAEILVDYALKRSATHDAIPNLYEERLIDKLLSLQDANQLKKLEGLAVDIHRGRRLNRLCDLYYREYDSMNEATWPADAEEVKLRKLLSDNTVAMAQVTSAFADYQLEEFDSQMPVCDPPNMTSTAFWTTKDALKWAALNLSEAEQDREAEPVEDPVPAAPPVQAYVRNPMAQSASMQTEAQHQTSHVTVPPSAVAAEVSVPMESPGVSPVKTEVQHAPVPSPVQAGIAKFTRVSVNNTNPLAQRRSSKKLSSISELYDHVKSTDKVSPVKNNSNKNIKANKQKSSPAEKNKRRTNEDLEYHFSNRSDSEESDIIDTDHGKANEVEDTHMGTFTVDIHSSDSETDDPAAHTAYTASALPPAAPPAGPELERDADVDGLSLMNAAAPALPTPPPVGNTTTRRKTAKLEVQPRARPTPAVPVLEEVPSEPTGRRPTAQPTADTAGSGKTMANAMNGIDQGTVKVAANGTGHTQTSGIKAMHMMGVLSHAAEVRTLDVLCVGDTKRLTNAMGPLKEQLYAIPPRGDALTVTVSDITGPNAGSGVAGLQVSGAVSITKSMYTMVFEVKVDPEEYQFNLLLYGMKRLEARWKNVTLLSANVLFKPAAKVQPRGAYAFHNAANNSKVLAGGVVVIHSRDDPRSTVDSPVFRAITVPYTGADVKLPPGLPADCIVTVSPDIPGYSNEYSEKFVLYGNERLASETMKMMLSESNITGSEWRVVLTWDADPSDLDLYCLTNFHPNRVYFGANNKGGQNDPNKGNIELDIDVRDGFGPETITFTPDPTKKYRFLVHNYSGNSRKTMASSQAKIVIHKGSGRPVQFDVPVDIVVNSDNECARFWHVFDLINGVMVPVNVVLVDDIRYSTVSTVHA